MGAEQEGQWLQLGQFSDLENLHVQLTVLQC